MTARDAADAADVVAHAELTDIRVYEVAARRTAEGVDPEDVPTAEDFSVNARGTDEMFETRGRLYLRTPEAEFVVEVGAIHSLDEPIVLPPHVAAEFIQRVGIMALYPFMREQVFSAARRLGVQAPVLGLLRAGEFKVEPTEEALAPTNVEE